MQKLIDKLRDIIALVKKAFANFPKLEFPIIKLLDSKSGKK